MDAAGVLNLMREAGMPAGVALDSLTDETRGDRAAAVRLLCDAIHAGLDAKRDDHGLRVLMADVLDVDAPGAGDGWRALGVLRRKCEAYPAPEGGKIPATDGSWQTWGPADFDSTANNDCLPGDWFDDLRGGDRNYSQSFRDYQSRIAADEAAAAAFLRLPVSRRAELLGAVAAG